MNDSITVVYSFRDKPVERLLKSVRSMRGPKNAYNVKFIVVAYGSSEPVMRQLRDACELA